jgi:hypothetical protein
MFDLFSIWMLVVAIAGMGVFLPNVSKRKITVSLSVLWLLLALIFGTILGFVGSGF